MPRKLAENLEELILYETENLHIFDGKKGLEIRINCGTHSVLVGKSPSVEDAKRTMERLEMYPKNLRAFLGVL